MATIESRCDSNHRTSAKAIPAMTAAHATVVITPSRIDPPNASSSSRIATPSKRPSRISIAGTIAHAATATKAAKAANVLRPGIWGAADLRLAHANSKQVRSVFQASAQPASKATPVTKSRDVWAIAS